MWHNGMALCASVFPIYFTPDSRHIPLDIGYLVTITKEKMIDYPYTITTPALLVKNTQTCLLQQYNYSKTNTCKQTVLYQLASTLANPKYDVNSLNLNYQLPFGD